MNKRVFIVHGWDGFPEENWFPWLKSELEAKGFLVFVPQLPAADEPRINTWVPALAESVGVVDEQTYFVGHSMGCQTIVRFLESLDGDAKVGGAVFVAGFLKSLSNLEDEEQVRSVADEWLKTPLNLAKVKSHLTKSVAIFSDNDPFIPLENQEEFRDVLHSKIIVEHGKGHFNKESGVLEIQSALSALLEISE